MLNSRKSNGLISALTLIFTLSISPAALANKPYPEVSPSCGSTFMYYNTSDGSFNAHTQGLLSNIKTSSIAYFDLVISDQTDFQYPQHHYVNTISVNGSGSAYVIVNNTRGGKNPDSYVLNINSGVFPVAYDFRNHVMSIELVLKDKAGVPFTGMKSCLITVP